MAEQQLTHSMLFRVSLGLGYLVAVNLTSGYLAEAFRYPSLWANQSEIFSEYAYPVIFTYALTHWLSMLPAMLLVMGMPLWDKPLLIKARWTALGILVLCFIVEMSDRFGRFQQIPFVLFIAVDAGLFLLLAFCFRPPLKWIIGIAATTGSLTLAWYLLPAIWTTVSQIPGREEVKAGLIAEVDLVVDWHDKSATYYMVLSDTIEPGSSPSGAEICEAAWAQYQLALVTDPPPEKISKPVIQFMANAWFDESRTVLFDAGGAGYSEYGEWACEFEIPVRKSEPGTLTGNSSESRSTQ